MSTYELLVKFPIQLFIILSPIAAIAVLVSMTQNIPLQERIKLSVEASIIASGILFIAAIFGPMIFSIFRITSESFSIAGGVYLMLIGISLLRDVDGGSVNTTTTVSKNIAISPIAMPLLSGPGTISFTCLMRSRVSGTGELLKFFIGITLVMSAVALCFISAIKVSNAISKRTMNFCQKITGIMIMCISAQVLASGINFLR